MSILFQCNLEWGIGLWQQKAACLSRRNSNIYFEQTRFLWEFNMWVGLVTPVKVLLYIESFVALSSGTCVG